ncbi:hypothetical protein PMAYCL1PPCAC_21187, partial [Pristionchus mayeri]
RIQHFAAMRRAFLPLLLLLRAGGTAAWFEKCACSPISKSSSCPPDFECDSSKVNEVNCTLRCDEEFQLMFRTGLPWRSTDFIGCMEGRHHPSTGSALAASVAAVACAAPSKCTNCVAPSVDSYCHPNFVCKPEAMRMTQTDDGCAVASCTWGELMTIESASSATKIRPTVPQPTASQTTVPQASPLPKKQHSLLQAAMLSAPELTKGVESTLGKEAFDGNPQAGTLFTGTNVMTGANKALFETAGAGSSAKVASSSMPFGNKGTPQNTGFGTKLNAGTPLGSNPGTRARPGTASLLPDQKEEKEYYDDSITPEEKPTLTTTTSSSSKTTTNMTSSTTTSSTEPSLV